MAKLDYIIICENAVLSKETNNLSLINTFDSIGATGFPALHPKFVVVISVATDNRNHVEKMIIRKNGIEVISSTNNFTGERHRWINNILNAVFPEEGLYEVAYYLDELFLGSTSLKVNRK